MEITKELLGLRASGPRPLIPVERNDPLLEILAGIPSLHERLHLVQLVLLRLHRYVLCVEEVRKITNDAVR